VVEREQRFLYTVFPSRIKPIPFSTQQLSPKERGIVVVKVSWALIFSLAVDYCVGVKSWDIVLITLFDNLVILELKFWIEESCYAFLSFKLDIS
jgi:hypothetical protein